MIGSRMDREPMVVPVPAPRLLPGARVLFNSTYFEATTVQSYKLLYHIIILSYNMKKRATSTCTFHCAHSLVRYFSPPSDGVWLIDAFHPIPPL